MSTRKAVSDGDKRVAVLCVLRSGQQFMLLRRSKEPNRGLITPVGGKLEPHESPKQAALREVREETGIQLSSVRYCGTLIDSAPYDYNWVCFVYVADIPFDKPAYCDEGELTWIDAATIHDADLPSTDLPIYRFVSEGRIFMINAQFDQSKNLVELTEEIQNEDLLAVTRD